MKIVVQITVSKVLVLLVEKSGVLRNAKRAKLWMGKESICRLLVHCRSCSLVENPMKNAGFLPWNDNSTMNALL